MDTSTSDNDTIHYDNDGNIVPDPAAQINIAQNNPATTNVLATAELVHHIVRYLPVSSYRNLSLVNHFWRNAIHSISLTFQAFDAAAKESFEATSKRIYILNAFVLQYSPAVDRGLPTGSSSHQFVFSCQARAGSADSYGSSSNSDGKSGGGESSGHTGTSGESSGISHLQRHHTHQPGHDLEPFHSFHTYQSSAIVPNSSAPCTSRATIGQMLGSPPDMHSYEADISTDSYASSIMVDVAEIEAVLARQHEGNTAMLKRGSRASTSSGNSGESSSGVGETLQGSYLPYASPIMEESSNPSARAYVGRYDTHSLSATGQGSSRLRGDRERALDYQRSIQEQEQQQYGHHVAGSRDIPMADHSIYSSGATSSSSYGPSSAHTPQQHQHHHSRRHHHAESDSVHISTTSGSSVDTSHHHHQQLQQQPHLLTRPKRNWSMAVETFYYQRAALNAMIVACREHMESHAGQGGHIVERTDTTRIIWNESTRQEHIWTITPSLMDRSNPGDFIEPDYDPHSSEHDSAW
ncbi:hypothetical protein BGZ95_009692 [Linnemannia exigua]|uniref:F-box domain-containing protein n=1 Tax=Linnemannia exigua TaxID=604196 RepID=A0AAD4H6F7_9FUNG|nr:hypothetical protein BGZ95_009692 [Linnemannia exigua]